mmetsp:Transcript_12273/g.42775  ORF Transcript_12273/g.42775 Transcript_12273/m.42775 type:complete len:87 (-) Transcript_12273:18-278(-)
MGAGPLRSQVSVRGLQGGSDVEAMPDVSLERDEHVQDLLVTRETCEETGLGLSSLVLALVRHLLPYDSDSTCLVQLMDRMPAVPVR